MANKTGRKIRSALIDFLIIAAPIVIMTAFVWFAQNKYLYHPSFNEEAYKTLILDENDPYEEIFIEDGELRYHGWGYKASEEASTLIYFGGNFESSENFMTTVKGTGQIDYLSGCNVIMIDYPGYGLSDGKTNYRNILRMAEQTRKYVSDSDFYGNSQVFIMGFSLGTGVATYVAANYDCDGLILLAPYDNGLNLYNAQLNIFHGPLRSLIRNPFPSDQLAARIEVPVLIFASADDEVIPYALSEKLNTVFKDSELITLHGYSHETIRRNKSVLERIRDFLNRE